MLSRATENAGVAHVRPAGLRLGHSVLIDQETVPMKKFTNNAFKVANVLGRCKVNVTKQFTIDIFLLTI